MDTKIFDYTDVVEIGDLNDNLTISNKGILRMLQEAANVASSNVGYGLTDIERTKRTWILLYWRLKFIKRVSYGAKLNIKTWAKFEKKIYSIRSFEVYDDNNELVAIADSKWVFANASTHSIEKISDELIELYGENPKTLFDDELKCRLKLTPSANEAYTYKVMRRDLDGNHHVNNLNFIDFANEALPQEVYEKNHLNINVIYKKEILKGDSITCYYENQDNTDIVYIYNKDTNTLNGIVMYKA